MGRPKKNGANGHASAGSNSAKTAAELQAADEELSKHEKVIETAKGKLQNTFKRLKEEGFDTTALKRARKDKREDPLEAQGTFDAYAQYRELLGCVEDAARARNAAASEETAEADRASADA